MLALSLHPFAVAQQFTTEAAARVSFEAFKVEHEKLYTMEEEETKFQTFMANLKIADKHNAEETLGAEHGVTKFSDLTPEEFKAFYLGYQPRLRSGNTTAIPTDEADNSEYKKDWTGKYTTSVKNQGRCGSCWAFSATEQVESDSMRTLGISTELSTQQVISCDKYDGGCNGGNTETAYRYLKNSNGHVSASTYPDTSHSSGSTGACSKSKESGTPIVKVKGFSGVRSSNDYSAKGTEKAMAKYVASTGPLSICVDASKWQSYRHGVMSNCGKNIDHCVQAVGINTADGYWKVRNSWAKDWGEDGFIRLAYGSNQCGLTDDPTHVHVVKA